MAILSIDEWISGPYAGCEVSGFVVEHNENGVKFKVKSVTGDDIPRGLTEGSVHSIPKRVVQKDFRILGGDEQEDLIHLALKLGMNDWAEELQEKFQNPFAKSIPLSFKVCVDEEVRVYSSLFEKTIKLVRHVRDQLYFYYKKAIAKGMSVISGPDEIKDTETLDKVLASICYVSGDKDGLKYIKNLVLKGE